MRNRSAQARIAVVAAIAMAVAAAGVIAQEAGSRTPARGRGPAGPGLTLTTTAFTDGGEIPAKYTQAVAAPVSPALSWSNVPSGVESFTLILHDPDTAPQRNSTDILHWLVIDIPGRSRSLPENVGDTATLPDGTRQLKNFRGGVGFMGPGAPAPGPFHHYTFELFALDTTLDLPATATRNEVLEAMNGHVVAKAALVGRFHR
jgi:Raf kinase inhibitor-like YbhB/YbcL family protein